MVPSETPSRWAAPLMVTKGSQAEPSPRSVGPTWEVISHEIPLAAGVSPRLGYRSVGAIPTSGLAYRRHSSPGPDGTTEPSGPGLRVAMTRGAGANRVVKAAGASGFRPRPEGAGHLYHCCSPCRSF